MCISPVRLQDGTLVACRGCRLCRDNRINDLVGRCVAEQRTSEAAFSVTLTYGGDSPNAAVLAYADVQNMLKRLRFRGFRVRYIVAGEYGTQKGRAHWHIVLFFKGRVPEVKQEARISWEFWPHGFSYFQRPDWKGFRYAMKYALKQSGNDGQSKALSMSKKPPLGYDFFQEMAATLVDRGLPVHGPEYSFADVVDGQGKARRFWLQGRMRELFLASYCDRWRARWSSEPPQTEFLLGRFIDPFWAKNDCEVEPVSYLATVTERGYAFKGGNREPLDSRERAALRERRAVEFRRREAEREKTRESVVGYLCVYDGARAMLAVAYKGGVGAIVKGDEEWIVSTSESVLVSSQLSRIGLQPSSVRQLSLWFSDKWSSE